MSDREPLLALDDDIGRKPAAAATAPRAFLALFQDQAGSVIACAFLSTLLVAASLLALDLLAAAKANVARMADATRIAVVIGSGVSSSGEADALKARIAAVPGVSFERSRDRQELLADIQQRSTGWTESSPLPEVWLFRFSPGVAASADGGARAAKAISDIAGVDAVRWDVDWIRAVDRGRAFVDRSLGPAVYGVLALAAAALFATYFILGRVLSASHASIPWHPMRVIAYVAIFIAGISTLTALGVEAWIASIGPRALGELLASGAGAPEMKGFPPIQWNQSLMVGIAAIVLALLGTLSAFLRK